MHELVVNLHMHTTYSDGSGTHKDIAQAALESGLDVVIVTDHNVLVNGPEGYFSEGKKRVLMLISEEIHDQARVPQKSHLLALGARRELATFAPDPQTLIDNVHRADGLAFLAHPYDPACKPINEANLSWEDWGVQGYTGIELWNGLSELKVRGKSKLHVLFYLFFPQFLARRPPNETAQKWDELLAQGNKVVAIGGSDAHEFKAKIGPFRRTVYPYGFHFRCINTHILTPTPLSGNIDADRAMVYAALAAGHAFVGYDLPGSTRGFRFTAQGKGQSANMGDEIDLDGGVTLTAVLPTAATCHLIRAGEVVQTWRKRETCWYAATQPGAYRLQVERPFLGRERAWIFSNPIYVR